MPVTINGREEKTILLENLSGTLKSLEKTIKNLNDKNAKLTKLVVFLAIITAATGIAQLWFSYNSNKTISEQIIKYTQQSEEPQLSKKHTETDEQKTFTPPLSLLNKQENRETKMKTQKEEPKSKVSLHTNSSEKK